MIGVIDYGAGNIRSLCHALEWVGCETVVSGDPHELESTERLILPGVGAFGDAMDLIRHRGIDQLLDEQVLAKGKPLLGVCLGMQLLTKSSSEHGYHKGLGYFDADVKLLTLPKGYKVPHVGWNEIHNSGETAFYDGLDASGLDFYFVHSYYVDCVDANDVLSTCNYGITFTAAMQKDNIVAAQYHPEKSQDNGIRFLENFVNWVP